jgi:hypothetical protein
MKRFTLYLEETLIALLKARQQKTGVTVAEQIRRAIADYLKRQKGGNQ